MKTLVLNAQAVAECLSWPVLQAAMADALTRLARGDALQPLRQVLAFPGGALGVMPGILGAGDAVGVKAIVVGPDHHRWGTDSHPGAVLLFDAPSGRLLALADATAVTALRTAAVSALATDRLARADASVLGLLGSGVQAASHLAALRTVRSLSRVLAWSPNPDHLADFAARMERRHGLPVEAAATAEAVVTRADILCTVTTSSTPVLAGSWLRPGVHINAVGASRPPARELDAEAVARCRLVVDRRASAFAEAVEVMEARDRGRLEPDQVAELGEVLAGLAPGRRSASEITVFRSLGLAVEDVAAAATAYHEAVRRHLGVWVELGGEPFDPA